MVERLKTTNKKMNVKINRVKLKWQFFFGYQCNKVLRLEAKIADGIAPFFYPSRSQLSYLVSPLNAFYLP